MDQNSRAAAKMKWAFSSRVRTTVAAGKTGGRARRTVPGGLAI